MSAQRGLQSGEQVRALLAQGGQVTTNAAEGNHSRFTAERARDLLLHFDHANISLGLVIVKRHSEVFQEGKHCFFAHLKPIKQVDRRMALACRLGWPGARRGIGSPALWEQAVIFSPPSEQGKRVQMAFPSLSGFLHALFHHQESFFRSAAHSWW